MWGLWPRHSRKFRPSWANGQIILVALLACSLSTGVANGQWTQFSMIRSDGSGDYLWSYPENWSNGVPDTTTGSEIGSDFSDQAEHCVLKTVGAECNGLQIAEHEFTDGSSLTIVAGGALTCNGQVDVGKDEHGFLIIEGTMAAIGEIPGRAFNVGGIWARGRGTVIVRNGGVLTVDGSLGIDISVHSELPATSGSLLELDDGTLFTGAGLALASVDPLDPGILKISGESSYTNAAGSLDVEAGIVMIDDDDATISIQELNLNGPDSKLMFTGDGVSTVYATAVTFGPGALLDVSELDLPDGTYRVVEGSSITDNGLAFAPGTDTSVWDFEVDAQNDDLLLSVDSGGLPINAAPRAVEDWHQVDHDEQLDLSPPGVLNNDTDPNDDALTAVLVSGPSHAQQFALNGDGSFSYWPEASWSGVDSFAYRAFDGRMYSPFAAIVRIIVNSPTAEAVGHWKLDEGAGDEAADASAYGNTGELLDEPLWQDGLIDGALHFDGAGDVIRVSDPGNGWELDLTDGLTIALWVYPETTAGRRMLVSKDDSYEFQTILEGEQHANYYLRLNNGGTFLASSTVVLRKWQHIAVTWDDATPGGNSGTVQYYYNGLPDGTTSVNGPLDNNNTDVGIGARVSGAHTFAGRLDDVRIYRRALSAAEIGVLAGVPASGFVPVAVDDSYSTDENVVLSVPAPGVLGNDTDADGDPLTAVLDTTTSNGALTLNADGSFSYTPNEDFFGSDSFTYHASDGTEDSNVATVTLTVNDVDDSPPDDLVLADDVLSMPGLYEACRSITLGPDLDISAGDPGIVLRSPTIILLSDVGVLGGAVVELHNSLPPSCPPVESWPPTWLASRPRELA